MKQFIEEKDIYIEMMQQLKDKFHDTLGHIFVDEILVMTDTEFEIKPPRGKGGEDPSEEAIAKWEDKKRKAWKFEMKKIPKLYRDALDKNKEFVLIVRQSLVKELTDAQVIAHVYSEMRKINHEYKLQKPDVHTFSDLAEKLGRSDWDSAYDLPNILEN
ncbi:gp132 [Bacillus phage G]|uniref:Gp132 n=1 Tax=Bacillus phage G TaxID=2884420 RepID=G3MBJ4_9CAUD|nr:gp132 [Bacillus phage G]AEO93394.1 gp132 [Bacillus phage G]